MKVKEAPGSEGHAAHPGVLFAVAAVTVTAPPIVATLRGQSLSAVLGVQRHWAWSICSVLAVDLVASGAMLADARRSAAEPVAHPVRQGGGNPLSILPDPVQGGGSPTLDRSSDPLPLSCPWGCWAPVCDEGRGERTRTTLPEAGGAEGGGEGSRPQLRPGSGASRAT